MSLKPIPGKPINIKEEPSRISENLNLPRVGNSPTTEQFTVDPQVQQQSREKFKAEHSTQEAAIRDALQAEKKDWEVLAELQLQVLKEMIQVEGNIPFFINADKVKEIKDQMGLADGKLLKLLYGLAAEKSISPISKFRVGVAALGASGNVYMGANIEFLGVGLNQTVHGEQCLAVNARNHNEQELKMIYLCAAPCGHCRQFLNEIEEKHKPQQFMSPLGGPDSLKALLPRSFGPEDLELKGGLLTVSKQPRYKEKLESINSGRDSELYEKAVEAAEESYAPYSKDPSGVAIRTKDGKIYKGSYLENAAFNPSLSPWGSAAATLICDNKTLNDIETVTLVEFRVDNRDPKVSHEAEVRQILKKNVPNAQFNYVQANAEEIPQTEVK